MNARYEVVIMHYHRLDIVCGGPRRTVQQYRWRWRARWAAFLINVLPSPHPLVFGIRGAHWRPILRLVPKIRGVA